MTKKTVVLGMSGGVDSSVAAIKLKEDGYNVIGATMLLLDDNNTKEELNDAKKVCEKLNIPHHIFDLREKFKKEIITSFIKSYEEAKTPNPCVLCNKLFKFGYFYEEAKKLNADYIATGHYAKIINNKLVMSDVLEKDQSYFLSQINKDLLSKIIFPLNKFKSKDEIRSIAEKYNLETSKKKDSEEICFITNNNYKAYLQENNIKSKPGNIILYNTNKILGTHNGIYNYTIGQRKGLNISYKEPLYVISLDKKNNNVIIGTNDDLYKDKLTASNINYLVEKDEFKLPLYAKIRSRGNLEEIDNIKEEDNNIIVTFKNKIRAITPGQYIVFYNENKVCLGGATIEK